MTSDHGIQGQTEFRDDLLAAYRKQCALTRCGAGGLLEAFESHSMKPKAYPASSADTYFTGRIAFAWSTLELRRKQGLVTRMSELENQ